MGLWRSRAGVTAAAPTFGGKSIVGWGPTARSARVNGRLINSRLSSERPGKRRKGSAGPLALVSGLMLLLALIGAPGTAAAAAAPTIRARTTAQVTADALPTVQINGVVWTQVMIGNIVYAGGDFTAARPAGAAPGTNQTARRNLLAYDITTGKLVSGFVPGAFNGQVRALAVSTDKKTLYVGGAFTKIGTSTRTFFAALDPRTGALRSMAPRFNTRVNAIAATGKAVYVGGWFTSVNGHSRTRLAALSASNGQLTGWAPKADDAVDALVLTPGSKLVVAGGAFTKLNSTSASGSGALDPNTGATRPWKINGVVKNGGKKSAILSLTTDSTTVYGTGYTYGTGNFEGVYAASVTDGSLRWLQDCHGDVYSALPIGDTVYSVGHAHYCSNIGGFPDTDPRSVYYRALAVSRTAGGTVATNGQTSSRTYTNFAGKPAPALYNWFPDLTAGTFTGMTQAAWSVVGNGTYISLGGEFPTVNGVAQQGLVRMAIPSKAPRKMGPQLSGSATTPTATLQTDGSVAVGWPANWDRDDLRLTYRLSRNGTVIDTVTASDPFWKLRDQTYLDTDPGADESTTASYTVSVSDSDGNTVTSPPVTVELPAPAPDATPSGGGDPNPPATGSGDAAGSSAAAAADQQSGTEAPAGPTATDGPAAQSTDTATGGSTAIGDSGTATGDSTATGAAGSTR